MIFPYTLIQTSITKALILNTTNTKAVGTIIAVEVRIATIDVQIASIRPISRATPQVGVSANIVKRAIRPIAVASNWQL